MADEVCYASVVVKNKTQPQSQVKNDNETVYDEVKVNKEPPQAKIEENVEMEKQNENVQQTPDKTGLLPDNTAERCRRYQQLAGCFAALCVLLLLSVIGVCVYLATVRASAARELNQLNSSRRILLEEVQNLTDLNNKLKNNITTLSADKKNLTDQIKNMEKTWNELNVSRAQWSVDSYCPKNKGRTCSTCQDGWMNQFSSCYAYNDAVSANRKTWQGARDECGTKSSDLTVVSNQAEKDYVINSVSPVISDIQGYWIGLTAVGEKWKWLDGSELADQSWMQQQPAADGQCVTSLQGRGWKSVSCNDRNAWICERKALIL